MRLLAAVLICVGASAHAAPTRIDGTLARHRGYEWKRSGWTADAYLVKEPGGAPSRWVYKRTKPTIREGLMPTRDPSMRTMFRDQTRGGDLNFGDAWVVANVDAKAAFVVKHGFLSAYRATHEGGPAYERLGPPLEDEREVRPGHYEQRYAHGTMTWSAERSTRVDFD